MQSAPLFILVLTRDSKIEAGYRRERYALLNIEVQVVFGKWKDPYLSDLKCSDMSHQMFNKNL